MKHFTRILMLTLTLLQAAPSTSFADDDPQYETAMESIRSSAGEIANRVSSQPESKTLDRDRKIFLENVHRTFESMSPDQRARLLDELSYKFNLAEQVALGRDENAKQVRSNWIVVAVVALVGIYTAPHTRSGTARVFASIAAGAYALKKIVMEPGKDQLTHDNILELKVGLEEMRVANAFDQRIQNLK